MTGNRVSRILALILVEALILQPMLTSLAFAGPRGAKVVAGDVSIQTEGSTTLIHASNGSIIDYRSFDIHVRETVQFIQPSSSSRVLNRIRSSLPTHIDGTLLANGQVYIVNPLGVFFGDGAHIDVGRLVAAAGHISNDDFLAGLDRFRLTGTVENLGEIQAHEAALIGNYVLNRGVIQGESVVVLAAGDDVFLMQPGERGFVQIDRSVLASDAYRVVNSGTIDGGAGNVVMAAGDLYSLAIFNSGTLRGGSVLVDGGATGRVTVGGVVDVAGRGRKGAGGSVQILGDEIAIEGAAIDASGTKGGQVLIGGDYQGQGDTRTATRTFVDATSTIKADAGTHGDGGKVIVWADDATGFLGDISARGGEQSGDGGFVEVSGKEGLLYAGRVDTRAPNGQTGTLLLDPRDVLIDNAPGTPLTMNMLAFSTMPTADLTVDAGDISGAMTDVIIQAHRDIQQAATGAINITTPNVDLTLQAGRDIQLDSTIVTNDGVVTLSANDPGADPAIRDSGLAPLPGSILMSPGSSITTGTADINLTVNPGAAGTVGDITLEALQTAGAINITTGGAIEAGSVADGTSDVNGGAVNLAAGTGIGTLGPIELGATTISADTTNGNIDLSNTSAAATTVSSLTTGTGSIDFAQSGGGSLAVTNATTTDGAVTLSNTGGDLTATTVTAGGTGRDVALTTTTSGSISVGSVTAAGDTITVISADQITEAGADAGSEFTAISIDLDAVNGIGAGGTIEVIANAISADTTNGNIDLSNGAAGTTTLVSMTTGAGTTMLDNVAGGLLVGTVNAGGAAGVATLISNGVIDDLAPEAGVDITAASIILNGVGGVGSTVANQLELNTPNLSITTSGNVNVDILAGSPVLTDLALDLDPAGASLPYMVLTAGSPAAFNLTAVVNDLHVGLIDVGTANFSLTNSNAAGAIDDATATDATTNITAGSIALIAGSGIGSGTNRELELASNTISAELKNGAATSDGNIDLSNTSAVATTVNTLKTGVGTITFAQSGGGTVTFADATTTDGAITLSNDDGDMTASTVTAGGVGDVSLSTTTSGSIFVGSVTATDDKITVDAADRINEFGTDGAADLTALTLDLDAENGIGTTDTLELFATIIDADTKDGNIDLANNNTADTTVNSLTTGTGLPTGIGSIDFAQSGGGTVTFTDATTTDGDITLSNDGFDLTATTVTAGGVGRDVLLKTTTLAAPTPGLGSIFVGSVTATDDKITVDAADRINEFGTDGAADLTALTLDLDAENGIGTTDTLELFATIIDADTKDGNIDLANNNTADTTVNSLTTGTGLPTGIGSIDFAQSGGGTVTFTDATTTDGDITLSNDGFDLTATTVTAGGVGRDVLLKTTTLAAPTPGLGSIFVGSVTATDDKITVDAADRINEFGTDGAADLTALTLDLDAENGIGTTDTLELFATIIDADTKDGNIDLANNNTADTTVNSLTTGTGLPTGIGSIDFAQSGGGTVTFTDATTTDGDITLSNDGFDLTATTVTAGGVGRDVLLKTTTLAAPTPGLGSIFVGSVTATDDKITVDAADRINEFGTDGAADLTALTLDLDAENGIGTTDTLELFATIIDADTTDGNIDLANNNTADTTVNSLTTGTGLPTGIGSIDFAQSGGGTVTFTDATTTDGDITLSNDGFDLTATTVTAGGVGRDVLLKTTTLAAPTPGLGSIFVGSVTATDDKITVDAADRINEFGTDGAADLTALTLDLDAENGIGTTDTLELFATIIDADTTDGNIDLANNNTADTTVNSLTTGTGLPTGIGSIDFAQSGGGTVTFTDATTTDGDITLSNDGFDLTATTVTAGGVGRDVLLKTTTLAAPTPGLGSIFVGSVTATDDKITVDAADRINEFGTDGAADLTALTLDLDAENGIGTTDTLELFATIIDADTKDGNIDLANNNTADTTVNSLTTGTGLPTGIGSIDFAQSGGGTVTFTDATTTDGDITLSNDGFDLTATTVTAGGVGRDVLLKTTTLAAPTPGLGSIFVGSVTATDDKITVDAADRINEFGTDGAADLTALTLDLDAENGIGTTDTLELFATIIDADTKDGNIDLSNNNAADTTVNSLTTGTGSINFAQSGSSSLTFTDVTTTDGDITLTNTDGDLAATTVTSGTGTVDIVQSGGGELALGGSTIDGPNGVTITSDGQINLTGDLTNFSAGGTGLTLTAVTQPFAGNANPAGIFADGDITFNLDNLGDLTITKDGNGKVAKISSTGTVEFRASTGGPQTALIGDVTAKIVRFAGNNLTTTFQRQRTIAGKDLGVDLFANRVEIENRPTINADPALSRSGAGGGNVFFAVGDLLASLTRAQLAVIPLVLNNPNPQRGGIFLAATGGLQPVLGQDREFSPFLIQTPDGTISIPPLPAEVQLASLVQEPPVETDAPMWENNAVLAIECSLYEGEAAEVIPESCSEFVGQEAENSDPRLQSEPFKQARASYKSLNKDFFDMVDALQAATDAYIRSATDANASGVGFRRFVDTQGAMLAARSYMRRLSDYTRALDALSAETQEGAGELKDFLADTVAELKPEGLSLEEFENAISAGPEGSNVPRSWEPGYLVATDLPVRAYSEAPILPAEAGGM